MGLLVVDLAGPMSVDTWSGMSFVFVAMEASTCFGVGKLLKSKTEAEGVLRDIVAMLERQSGKKLKIIRTDNGNG